ncbi:hypothetical protein TPHA_0E02640 [Tetrapisispora phaffii CBS 4417]|uniref:Uncharacterized protein n=1 Tax=Tetrapisispora phaffii (strain ATCC 24235 / CBS 4417 / NBRC 1672 / NRRL Y-8282 / UCD 70-5) TaxID=1071381 RepID=G8BTX8_TETPH|nr:hypothetical protein TPHA_0E02640 [Tetrapisispora phaffii CBS 4417]CCE63356.1 hypothetical protein TPHA_0E02640 [Tetrapisispora phaffii CBS 4417]
MNSNGKIAVGIDELGSIYEQLHRELEERIELHLPGAGEAEKSNEVRVLVQRYLDDVVGMCVKSMDVTDAPDGGAAGALAAGGAPSHVTVKKLLEKRQRHYVEPFDLQLHEEVRDKYGEWEDWVVRVSEMRTRGPSQINAGYTERKEAFLQLIDERIGRALLALASENDDAHDTGAPRPDDVARWEGAKHEYMQALASLSRCSETGLKQELDRAKNLVTYLENK